MLQHTTFWALDRTPKIVAIYAEVRQNCSERGLRNFVRSRNHEKIAVATYEARDIEEDLHKAVGLRVGLVMMGVPPYPVGVHATLTPLALAKIARVEAGLRTDTRTDAHIIVGQSSFTIAIVAELGTSH
jgi:hypothetical protein